MVKVLQKNDFLPPGGPYFIPVGKGRYAHVDFDDYSYLNQYRWFVKMSHARPYVVRRVRRAGRESLIRMHREVMQTPKGMQCHHINFDTFDMRKSQLQNLSPTQHGALHVERRIRLQDKPVLRRAHDWPILAPACFPAKNHGTPSEKK